MNHNSNSLTQLQRHELDIHPIFVIISGVILTVFTYLVLQLQTQSYIATLLLRRGVTQYFVAFCAWGILTFVIIKFFKVQREFSALRQSLIPSDLVINSPSNLASSQIIDALKASKSALARRCERVIAAYRESENADSATQIAFDDSSFYLSATNTSYIFPRILAWAIPLLGFVGTVIGISSAIAGFSGFLEQAGEIDELKAGIGEVTTGLAVAFDTTFLALLLSVIVMIPLSLVERLEARALLGIDVYINERLLKKLPNESKDVVNREVIEEVIENHVPSAETLIQPAQVYAEKAANQLAEAFLTQLHPIQDLASQLSQELKDINQVNQQQQKQNQEAFKTLARQIEETHEKLIEQIQSHPELLKEQTKAITTQLEQTILNLQEKTDNLEQYTTQIERANEIQERLNETLRSLQDTNQLFSTFERIENYLAQLKPVLEKLNQPRHIILTETSQESYVSTSFNQEQS